MATFKEMCEVIAEAKIGVKPDGTHPTADEIFNYSSRGELFIIPIWYQQAKSVLDARPVID